MVYIALGSNLGDRESNLALARRMIHYLISPILQESSIYETPAWGLENQPDFLNQVVAIETDLSPQEILNQLKTFEIIIGREPSERWGPRLIDLDILFYDDLILDSDELIIPHPQLEKRLFVLQPMLEISPYFVHPASGRSLQDIKNDLIETSEIRKL